MIWVRSAMLMLIACVLHVAPSRGSQSTDLPVERIDSRIASHPAATIAWPDSPRPSRGTTLSRFTPWKSRIKSVLEESKQRVNEECDLGPATESGRLIALGTVELPSFPLLARHPLRC
jgi:hypothetical protein